jgi:hypothetical protein
MTSGPALPRLASLTSVDLALSILIPIGWDVQGDAEMLRVSGPEVAGRRPTFTIRSGRPEQPGEDWFTAFREQAVARMPDAIPGFVLLDRQDFVLSSFVDVTAVAYRRSLGGGDEVSQLQAYLWASSYRMYVVDAATGRRSEDADLPLFDAMLRSIRLLPERR